MDNSSEGVRRNLAQNVIQLRRRQGLSQGRLAARAGVPRSTLANLETGRANPSLSNLSAVAGALRVSIEELIAPATAEVVRIPSFKIPRKVRGRSGVTVFDLLPDSVKGFHIERLELVAGALLRGTPHLDGTKEYLTCLEGSVRVSVLGSRHDVQAGDVLAFPGHRPHTYQNPTRKHATALSVVALVP